MTDEERYEIATLAEAEETARMRWEQLKMRNQATDPERRIAQATEYHIAETELWQASARLSAAKNRIADSKR